MTGKILSSISSSGVITGTDDIVGVQGGTTNYGDPGWIDLVNGDFST